MVAVSLIRLGEQPGDGEIQTGEGAGLQGCVPPGHLRQADQGLQRGWESSEDPVPTPYRWENRLRREKQVLQVVGPERAKNSHAALRSVLGTLSTLNTCDLQTRGGPGCARRPALAVETGFQGAPLQPSLAHIRGVSELSQSWGFSGTWPYVQNNDDNSRPN